MPKFQGNQNYAHDSNTCLGVLITNLGTPDAPTTSAVRKYLAEFLWDPRVIEIPRPIWWLILHGFVLRTRPGKSVHAYEKVWTEKGSPLLAISKQQCVALQSELGKVFSGNIRVELAMRYGQPSIRSALDALQAHHVTRILVLPLYPQYSASTTASTFDAIAKYFMQLRWMPELRIVNHYGSEPAYIDACAEQLQNYWQQNKRSQKLLFSFHGLPMRNLLQGDPYHCECHQTARLIVEKLNLNDEEWEIAFQSRFGKAKWLQPYIEKRLEALPGEGIKTIDVFCPGFSADCIETLEEIDMQDRELFLQSGGQNFNYIPALNAESHHVQALVKIILKHISGWPADESSLNNSEAKLAIKERAIQLGAKQ